MMRSTLLFYKSFYIHHAGVNIFIHGLWMKGWSDLLFAFFAFNSHWQRSDQSIALLLFFKVIDATILVVCRFLLCFWNKQINQNLPKILLIFHCLTWTYIYVLFVPENVLWGSNSKNLSENFYMWMWFISECLNSIWLRLFCRLEIYLFPPPSKDAIQFANRLKKQKASSVRKPSGQNAKKAELLKTLTCVMSMKKKLQRIRKAKEEKIGLHHKLEEEKDEIDSDEDHKKEIMQTLISAMKVRKEIQNIRKDKRNNLDPEIVTSNKNTETDFESGEIENKKFEETTV
ncbi:uncharacterized protein LOC117181672 [Belonocnema kinseyi]|uniref:uncharacterized protein LOC117181672 n=1 Tax=Belonocnema kinseyi TaxID=2817044 RepID=UPI00143DDFC4|nr:uncharacterized protein LOC117181672 [Belonocnema kinseyi]